MSLDGLKSLFDTGAVILLFLTFAFGLGALITGNILNERQASQLRKFDQDLTRAKADNLHLEEQIEPRRLTMEQKVKITDNCSLFKDLFKGKRVRVVSYSLDVEGFVFAEQLVSSLRASGMTVDDDAMSITPGATFIIGTQVFGLDTDLAKKLADAIGSSGRPIAVSFAATDPTAGAIKIEYGAPVPQATILVGFKPPDKDTIDELKRVTKPHK